MGIVRARRRELPCAHRLHQQQRYTRLLPRLGARPRDVPLRQSRLVWAATLAVVGLLAVGALVLRDGSVDDRTDGDVAAVEDAIGHAFAAYNAVDVERFLAAWTERGFADAFGVTKAQAAEVPPGLSGLRPLSKSTVDVDTSTATVADRGARASVVLTDRHVVRTFDLRLVTVDGTWLIDAATERPSVVPPGWAVVPLELREYRIRLRADTVARSVVFQAANAGRKSHQLLLLQLDDALGTEESIGRTDPVPSGGSWPLVLRDLEPGRYALVCNLLDERGVPHSSRGMRVEFAVP